MADPVLLHGGTQCAVEEKQRMLRQPLLAPFGFPGRLILLGSEGVLRGGRHAILRGILSQCRRRRSELRAQATAHGVELVAVALRACVHAGGGARQVLRWGDQWRATALDVPPVRPPEDRQLQVELARYREITNRLDKATAEGAPVATLHQSRVRAERAIRAFAMRTGGVGSPAANRPLDVRALLDELGGGQLVEIVEVDGRLHALLCGRGRVRRFPAGTMAEAGTETEYARSALLRLAHGAAARPADTAELLATTLSLRESQGLTGPSRRDGAESSRGRCRASPAISNPTPFGRPSSSTISTIFHTRDRPERAAAPR